MFTRRFFVHSIHSLAKFPCGISEVHLRRSFTQQCLLPSLFGMNMHSNSSTYGFLRKEQNRQPYVSLQVSWHRNMFTKSKKEVSLRVKDKISSGYHLIYKAPMDNYIKYGQWITSMGIAFTVALSLHEFYSISFLQGERDLSAPLSHIEFVALYMGLASTVTFLNVFLNSFTVRMYHNPSNDAYIAVFFNSLGLLSKLEFNKGQIKPYKTSLPLPWRRNLFTIDGKTAILNEIHFRLPADYNALFDFDKVS